MLSDHLLSELHQLSQAEKLRVVQILVNELAMESDTPNQSVESLLKPGIVHEIWSPYDSLISFGCWMA